MDREKVFCCDQFVPFVRVGFCRTLWPRGGHLHRVQAATTFSCPLTDMLSSQSVSHTAHTNSPNHHAPFTLFEYTRTRHQLPYILLIMYYIFMHHCAICNKPPVQQWHQSYPSLNSCERPTHTPSHSLKFSSPFSKSLGSLLFSLSVRYVCMQGVKLANIMQ